MTGEACGTPLVPWQVIGGPGTPWSHSSAPPDNCLHAGTDHAVTVTVEVLEDGVPGLRCVIDGAETRSIANPACQSIS